MAEGNKTEKATPKKRRDQRKKGNVFLSNDAVAVATLLGTYLALRVFLPRSVSYLRQFLMLCFQDARDFSVGKLAEALPELFKQAVYTLAMAFGPLALIVILTAVVATFAQTRMLFSPQAMRPKFSRINPIEGFKRLFSMRSLIEALKNTLKIAALLFILYRFFVGQLSVFPDYLDTSPDKFCIGLFNQFNSMMLLIIAAFFAVAAFDFFYQWWDYERQMRMTVQEVKEEFKQTEGDPQIKSRIRDIQRKMAQSRMMQQVPKADVVIRNPTHVAVALRYRPDQDNAPLVLAKGLDYLAQRIVVTAENAGVHTIENVQLAHALYDNWELNCEIPQDLYGAVADVLAYIYRLNKEEANTTQH